MAARIVKRTQRAVRSAHDDQRLFQERGGEVVAGIARFALVSREQPGLGEDAFRFELERARIGVEAIVDPAAGVDLRRPRGQCGCYNVHRIKRPPLTAIVCPVMYELSLLSRKRTTPTTSAGVPTRPSGMRGPMNAARSFVSIGVSIGPGATLLARMPYCAFSSATDFISAS